MKKTFYLAHGSGGTKLKNPVMGWNHVGRVMRWYMAEESQRERQVCCMCCVRARMCAFMSVFWSFSSYKATRIQSRSSTVRILNNPICLPKVSPLKITGLNFPLLNLTLGIAFQFSWFKGMLKITALRSIDLCHYLSASIIRSSLLFP